MDYDYEDELDRMRNRKKRNAEGGRSSAGRSPAYKEVHNGRSRYSERSSSTDYDNRKPPKRKSRKQTAAYGADNEDGRRFRKDPQAGKKRKKKKKLLIIELAVLAILAGAAFFLFGKGTGQKGYWTIAVFGVDSRTGKLERGTEADVEMLCNINKATGEIKLVSVYRDTYLKIDSKGTYFKINEAYNKGGHKQTVAALEENLDIKIDDYATFNWKSAAEAINILGGVDIDITGAEFSYINGFITETVNSTGIGSYQLKKAGMNHLDGVQAVAYARLRLMDTDFNRTERQRKVLSLALQKAREADPATLRTLVSTVFPQVSTSIGIDDLFTIASGITKYHITETGGFPFSRINMKIDRRDCVVPTTLESNVIQLHQFLYGVENYIPSAAVKTISAKLSKISGISEPGKNAPAGNGSKGQKPAMEKKDTQTAPPPEREPAKEETSEMTAETTKAAVTKPEAEVPEKETNPDGSLIGPGAEVESTAGKPEGTVGKPESMKPGNTASKGESHAADKAETEQTKSPGPGTSKIPSSPAGGGNSPKKAEPGKQLPAGEEQTGEAELTVP